MDLPSFVPAIIKAAPEYRDRLLEMREIVLANTVMSAEIPSPTFLEDEVIRFVCDRLTEAGVQNIATDEAGNASGIHPGKKGKRNILVIAHADTIWDANVDHTVSVSEETISGAGLADNSLGIGALVTLPAILEHLGIELNCNLILIAASRSLGRGDLEGIRFFLENATTTADAGICVEGAQLGRLSYSSVGMVRAEIEIRTLNGEGAISSLTRLIDRIQELERPEKPRTEILLGSANAGSGFNIPPETARLRFEIRSESADLVDRLQGEVEEIVDEINATGEVTATMSVIATRQPGDMGFSDPLVRSARAVMEELEIAPHIQPSTSELSALLDQEIPALTLGLTTAEHTHTLEETIHILPLFRGLAQLVATLQIIDHLISNDAD